MPLNTSPNLTDLDGFYDALLRAHEGLSPEQSSAFNARLILILANHVGDTEVLNKALQIAMQLERQTDTPKHS